jgi:glycine cleavage system H lipoate-binding protein
VVRHKACRVNYRCETCRFDRALRRVAAQNRSRRAAGRPLLPKGRPIAFWKDRLTERPPWQRPCIHHMQGRITFRACTQAYRCADCEFDQYFYDQLSVHAVIRPVDVLDVEGFKIPHGFYCHPGHTWVKMEEDSTVRVGLDEFALRLLGPPDRIEGPLVGKPVAQDHPAVHLQRGTCQARFPAPVSGVVTDLNPALRERGELAHEDPYAEGWIMRVHAPQLRRDLKRLTIGRETETVLKKDIDRLHHLIEQTAGPLSADGGFLGNDLFGNLPQIGWQRLVELIGGSEP